MTTRRFSATDLPHPRYSLEVGRFTIRSQQTAGIQSAPAVERRGEQHRQKQKQKQHEERTQLRVHQERRGAPDKASGGGVGVGGKRKRGEDDCDDNNGGRSSSSSDYDANDDDDDDDREDDHQDDVNLPSTCLPRFSQLAQVIEARLPGGFTLPNRVGSNIKDFLGSYCVIESARPELFVRRDFISKFVDKGTIHVAQLSDLAEEKKTIAPTNGTTTTTRTTTTTTTTASSATTAPTTATTHAGDGGGGPTGAPAFAAARAAPKCGYKLSTRDNVLIITMNSKQYHRFGLLATRQLLPLQQQQPGKKSKRRKHTADKCYRVEINLHDERIMKSNKYQDKLMQTLGRLSSINKIYFRFIPDKSKFHGDDDKLLSPFAAHEYSQEFFSSVIDEYARDGCQPVPLTRCSIALQRVERAWINRAQVHPSLELSKLLKANQADRVLFQAAPKDDNDGSAAIKLEALMSGIIDMIDWSGYQLLSLDCDTLAKLDCWPLEVIQSSTVGGASKYAKAPAKRYDVSCTRIIGAVDYQHVQANLRKLFAYDAQDDIVFRAMFLHDAKDDKQLLLCQAHDDDANDIPNVSFSNQSASGGHSGVKYSEPKPRKGATSSKSACGANAGVVYLQDCSNGPEAASEITVIGLSELAA